MVKDITSTEEFNNLIASDKKVIVEFQAVCSCKAIAPKFEAFSKEFTDIEFVKVDIDDLLDVSANAGLRATPTFIAYHNGAKFEEVLGADINKLKALVENVAKV
ncbi:Cytoplasmic thioredoxin isoenzyme 2 [Entomortierella beljakovae]|nr:Cytoplasmic thioredoxin isoenzyme 2 [Entomortierella beljakovae]